MRQNGKIKLLAALAFTLCSVMPTTHASAQFNAFKDPAGSGGSTATASGPDLKAASETIQGGKVTVGATVYIVGIFKNNGSAPVKVTGTNLYPSSTVSAKVSLNKCAEAPLPPEGECAVTVAVTGLQIGGWRVEILLDHDGRTRLAALAITGDVDGATEQKEEKVKSEVEATPEVLDFGNAKGGSPLVRAILVRNRTSDKVSLKSIRLDAPAQSGYTLRSECPETLEPSESCIVPVTWNPTTRGVTQAVLMINHSAKSSLTQVEVKGNFEPETIASATIYPESMPDTGLLISDKDKIDFGSGVEGVSAITASLVNVGSSNLSLKSIRLSGSDNGLSIARTGCANGLVLKPTDACALTVNWVPSREGAVIDDLQILHSGARGVLVLPIRGTADAAASRETLAVRQPSMIGATSSTPGGAKEDAAFPSDVVGLTPVLDGYSVTSHSPSKAVINGPVGSLVVRDGEDVVVSGVKWTVTIVSTGVVLTSADDEILLVFDRSLKPRAVSSSSSSSSKSTTTTAPKTTTPAAAAATTTTTKK